MDDFKFKNITASQMGVYCKIVSYPLFPEPKTCFEDLPGCDGEMDFSANNERGRTCFKPRYIELECHVAQDNGSKKEFSEKLSKIASWLHSESQEELIFTDDENMVYLAKAANLFNIENVTETSATFPLIFRCDPFKYKAEKTILTTDSNIVTVQNGGYFSGFDLKLTGVISNPFEITNGTKKLRIDYPLTNESTLKITTEQMNVTHNGLSILNYCDGEFFELSPGENQITLNGDFSSLQMELSFRERYL